MEQSDPIVNVKALEHKPCLAEKVLKSSRESFYPLEDVSYEPDCGDPKFNTSKDHDTNQDWTYIDMIAPQVSEKDIYQTNKRDGNTILDLLNNNHPNYTDYYKEGDINLNLYVKHYIGWSQYCQTDLSISRGDALFLFGTSNQVLRIVQ